MSGVYRDPELAKAIRAMTLANVAFLHANNPTSPVDLPGFLRAPGSVAMVTNLRETYGEAGIEWTQEIWSRHSHDFTTTAAIAATLAHGPKVYRPTRRVAEALQQTRMSGMTVPDGRTPAFYVHLRGLFNDDPVFCPRVAALPEEHHTGEAVPYLHTGDEIVYVDHVMEGIYVVPVACHEEPGTDEEARKVSLLVLAVLAPRHRSEMTVAWEDYTEAVHFPCGVPWSEAEKALEKGLHDRHALLKDSGGEGKEIRKERARRLARLALILWQVVHLSPESVRLVLHGATAPSQPSRNPKKARKLARRTTSHRYIEVDLDEPDEPKRIVHQIVGPEDGDRPAGTHASPRHHWVRDHWRFQAHGPARAHRRWTRVRGHFRGAIKAPPTRQEITVAAEGESA